MTLELNTHIRFFVRWSDRERTGTITRVGHATVWIGAFCYHVDDLSRVRKVTP